MRVDEFEASHNLRRAWERNLDLAGRMVINQPIAEHYGLFRRYLDTRHSDGGMADMSMLDFAMMVEDSHIETRLVEYRLHGDKARAPTSVGALYAVSLTDVLADGLSMVYSFYAPQEASRSLGTFMILDHIDRAKRMGLPYLYLGYWIEGSRKMAYKARFMPQERLGLNGWERFTR